MRVAAPREAKRSDTTKLKNEPLLQQGGYSWPPIVREEWQEDVSVYTRSVAARVCLNGTNQRINVSNHASRGNEIVPDGSEARSRLLIGHLADCAI